MNHRQARIAALKHAARHLRSDLTLGLVPAADEAERSAVAESMRRLAAELEQRATKLEEAEGRATVEEHDEFRRLATDAWYDRFLDCETDEEKDQIVREWHDESADG